MPGHLLRDVEADDAASLERVTARFRELLAQQNTKPASAFEHMAVQCCDAAGRIAHRLIEQQRLTLPNLPGEFEMTPEELHPNEPEIWFEDEAGAHREANIITCYEQWWLAFLGWLAMRDDLAAVVVDPRVRPALDRCLWGLLGRRQHLYEIPIPDSKDNAESWPLVCEASMAAIGYLPAVLGEGSTTRTAGQKPGDVPPLDKASGKWLSNREAAKREGLETRSLADYRKKGQGGRKASDGLSGIDRDGRMWRRLTTNAHPWYYIPSLKNNP